MISTVYRFIFLHVPKTGGNTVQTCLLPYSDDRKTTTRAHHQDGVDRFGIKGPVTPNKHALLSDYHARLGARLGDYRILITRRHPVDRALSMYFSPHRLLHGALVDGAPFDHAAFLRMIGRMKTLADFLRVEGQVRQPDTFLRFERLAEDLADVMTMLGLPPPDAPRLNRTADTAGLRDALKHDAAVIQAVERRFAEDYDLFGFERR